MRPHQPADRTFMVEAERGARTALDRFDGAAAGLGPQDSHANGGIEKPETTSIYDNGMRSGLMTPAAVAASFRTPMRPMTSSGLIRAILR